MDKLIGGFSVISHKNTGWPHPSLSHEKGLDEAYFAAFSGVVGFDSS